MVTIRNEPQDVRDLYHTSLADLDDSTIQVHLRAAARKVERIPRDHDEVTAGLLEDVELYLACDRVESQVPRPTNESQESTSATYSEDSPDYRDIAEDLDPTGTVGDKGPQASIDSVSLGE